MNSLLRTYSEIPDADRPVIIPSLAPYIRKTVLKAHIKHHNQQIDFFNKYYSDDRDTEIWNNEKGTCECNFYLSSHQNHTFFWENLAPRYSGGGHLCTNTPLWRDIHRQFGSFGFFLQKLKTKARTIQGSGYLWLAYNQIDQKLEMKITMNEEQLIDLIPIMVIDLWEHAYFHQYGNNIGRCVRNLLKIINWQVVSTRYDWAKALSSSPSSE